MQMNYYDSYTARPSKLDRSFGDSLPMNRFERVPIIRVFGPLISGHQVLCHIHGVFPYFFVPYNGNSTDASTVIIQKCAQLHRALEKKLSEDKDDRQYPYTNKKNHDKNKWFNLKHVANVSIVKAVPFYGFQVGWQLFFKISFLNPSDVTRAAQLMRIGNIFKKNTDVFEAHIPYLLQFSADYNLSGCSWLSLEKCFFRKPVLNSILDIDNLMYNDDLKQFLETFCREDLILSEFQFKRIGNGLLEIDVIPQFITNRENVKVTDLHNNFIEKTEDMSQVLNGPFVNSTKTLVKNDSVYRTIHNLKKYKKPEKWYRTGKVPHWQSESLNNQILNDVEKYMNSEIKPLNLNFNTFIKDERRLNKAKRPIDAINELWPLEIHNDNSTNRQNENILPKDDDWLTTINVSDENNSDEEDPVNEEDLADGLIPDSEEIVKNATISVPEENKRIDSLDMQLTQSMAAKKRQSQIPVTYSLKPATQFSSFLPSVNPFEKDSYKFKKLQLQFDQILPDFETYGVPQVLYPDPYFSNRFDMSGKPYTYAGKRFNVDIRDKFSRNPISYHEKEVKLEEKIHFNLFYSWKYISTPPNFDQVLQYIATERKIKKESNLESWNIVTPSKQNISKSKNKKGSMSHFSMECFAKSKPNKKPDPSSDPCCAISWHVDEESYPFDLGISYDGILIVKEDTTDFKLGESIRCQGKDIPIMFYDSEEDMFDALMDLVLVFDCDILSGFEVHNLSWGYVIERARLKYKYDLNQEFSRINFGWERKRKDGYGYRHSTDITILGRYVINIWRAMRSEMSINQYTFENIVYHSLKLRLPKYSQDALNKIWEEKNKRSLEVLLRYFIIRTRLNVQILSKQEYISRIKEQARLIGIDFGSVYYRGSQFKVESFLSRICKAQSFLLFSASKDQVQEQIQLDCVPLIMEPSSSYYKSPLLVLDFQSLYPSIICAYNYCYSTMLGSLKSLKLYHNKVGSNNTNGFNIPKNMLKLLEKDLTISPNGIVFVNESVRKSTLAKMLTDLLDTRVMVKDTISGLKKEGKEQTSDKNEDLIKLLNNQQLALKLLANVTYGYTSASFSGRMPCSELADAVVQTGREILEHAINIIEADDEWGGKVVYGDTDSLFVYLPGKTRDDAFRIGQEMVERVTSMNKEPVILKFEKVYHPCLLVSKKRYVGYSYLYKDQEIPNFDAKGIETVRRDGYPALQKIVEKSLKIFFDTGNLSELKEYLEGIFFKINNNNDEDSINIKDFCFAREVKIGYYKSDTTAPPGAHVAMREMKKDKKATPQYKERVPYLVVKGRQGQTLRDRSIAPEEFIKNIDQYVLDSEYYIKKTIIPPLERLFNCIGISIADWYRGGARYQRDRKVDDSKKHKNVYNFFNSLICVNCNTRERRKINNLNLKGDKEMESMLCEECYNEGRTTALTLTIKKNKHEANLKKINRICRICAHQYSQDSGDTGEIFGNMCTSRDCPVYFLKIQEEKYFNSEEYKNIVSAINEW